MKRNLKIGVLLLCSLYCTTASAQSVQQVEQGILTHLQHIQYWRFEYSPEDTSFKTKVNPEDSLINANKMLADYLAEMGTRQPATLRYSFQLPENSDMKIVSSDDGRLRTYSWDTHSNTDEHVYTTVYQYETSKGIKTTKSIGADAKGRLFQKINTVGNSYLAISSDMAPENNVTKTVLGLAVSGDKLVAKDIFVNAGKAQSSLSYTYNYSSNYDFKKMKEEFDIRFEKQKLYIPEVADFKMTGKYAVYNLTDDNFILDTNTK